MDCTSPAPASLRRCLPLLLTLAVFLGPGFFARPLTAAPEGQDRPNILLIFTDDQGINDVGCYGSEIPTPNIDRLAAEGLNFENFYSASAICTPSRFGLLTGMNPSRSRDHLLGALMFMSDEDKQRGIHPEETTIAEVLRDRGGYHTALTGKWHLGHGESSFLPTHHGFDRFRGHTGGCIDFFTMTYGILPDWYHNTTHISENGYATDLITDEAVAFLKDQREAENPFFLYLAYNAPHFGKGWSPGEQKPVNLMQPKAEEMKRVAGISDKIRREYAAMVVSLDDGIGEVLTALDHLGLTDNTLVIFLTDHGGDPVYGGNNEPYRAGKATLFDGGLRVPCLMRWPGKISAGRTVESPAWSIDLFPTFCALTGTDAAGLTLDGQDLSQVLLHPAGTGLTDETGREFFWQLGKHEELGRRPWEALRQGRWKYVSTPNDGEFLFDLETDPYEKENLAEGNEAKFQELKQQAAALGTEYSR